MLPHEFKTARLRLSLTQQALAAKLELTVTAVAMMERGERPIMRVTQLAIEHLRCTRKRKP